MQKKHNNGKVKTSGRSEDLNKAVKHKKELMKNLSMNRF